jgi:Fe-S cluster assembly iron-binding protein IscA
MALDEPKESDVTFNDQGIMFAIEKDLFEQADPIGIDFVETPDGSGFSLTSNLTKNGGCC